MHVFLLPALDFLYSRVQNGFAWRQKLFVGLLGLVILLNFMFRAACPPERRFFSSPRSATTYVCAPSDVVNISLPLGGALNPRAQDRPESLWRVQGAVP